MRRAAALLALVAVLPGCVPDREAPRSTRERGGPGYTVREGDTLSAIAQRNGLSLSALARANGIPPPYLIRIGQKLRIPPRGTVPPPRSVSRPVIQPVPEPTYPPPLSSRPGSAPVQAVGPRLAGAPRLAWPADGPVGERFGSGADPRGIAFATHAGTAVRAAAAGTVLFAGAEPQKYGQLVLVDHGDGWVTAYGNLGRVVVSTGEALRTNARIGFAGDRPLHFELRRNNQPVDPLPQFPPRF